MLTAIIVTTSIAQIIISLFVYFRARNNVSYRLFFFIGITSLSWALANYLTVNFLDSDNLIYFVRAILFFVVLQNTAFCPFIPRLNLEPFQKVVNWLRCFNPFGGVGHGIAFCVYLCCCQRWSGSYCRWPGHTGIYRPRRILNWYGF